MVRYHAVAEFGANQWAVELAKGDRIQGETVCFPLPARDSKDEVEESITQAVQLCFDFSLPSRESNLTVDWKGVADHQHWLERFLAWRERDDRGEGPSPGQNKRVTRENTAARYHAIAEFGGDEWMIQWSQGSCISSDARTMTLEGWNTKDQIRSHIDEMLLIEWNPITPPAFPPWEIVLTVEWRGESAHREWRKRHLRERQSAEWIDDWDL